MTKLSVIIPVLDAAAALPRAIASLGVSPADVVVVDGGSRDGSTCIAQRLGARVVRAPRGRGSQLAAGIAATDAAWLLLLHADTRLGGPWLAAAENFMAGGESRAAYFRFALDSASPRARRLERWVAWRCRVLALPYGDQGLLIARSLLAAVGGVRPLVLMEDVDLVRRLGRERLSALEVPAITSAAKWERDGWTRRSVRNLCCLSLYYAGVPPSVIARLYS